MPGLTVTPCATRVHLVITPGCVVVAVTVRIKLVSDVGVGVGLYRRLIGIRVLYVIQFGNPVDRIGCDADDEKACADLHQGESLAGAERDDVDELQGAVAAADCAFPTSDHERGGYCGAENQQCRQQQRQPRDRVVGRIRVVCESRQNVDLRDDGGCESYAE